MAQAEQVTTLHAQDDASPSNAEEAGQDIAVVKMARICALHSLILVGLRASVKFGASQDQGNDAYFDYQSGH